jgi:hypothetical protein
MSTEPQVTGWPRNPTEPWIREVHEIALSGEIDAATQLSGAAVAGEFLVLGADEGHLLQVLARTGDGRGWSLLRSKALAREDQETDIEAIAWGDGYLFVIGSHSTQRRVARPDLSARRNRERMLEVRRDDARNRLFRIPFDRATGRLGKAETLNLNKRLRKDPLLHLFHGIPGKENGIDLEGLAYRDGELTVGFRGPVLRGNFVPVMHLPFDHPKRYRLSLVRLEGQGIRDLVALAGGGYLLLSGPVNDAPGPFRLWWWDGQDQVSGKDREIVPTLPLGEISTPGGAKAEGLALAAEHEDSADVIVVYETATSAKAVGMQVALPT